MYTEQGFHIYHITEKPIKLYGLSVIDKEKRQFYKLPEFMLERMPRYAYLGRRACGGRVRFRTDSSRILVRMTLNQAKEDKNIPLSGSAGADVYLGVGEASRFIGYIAPEMHTMEEVTAEKFFSKTPDMEVVTINLPRNDHVLSMEIGVEEGAQLLEAPAYRIDIPIIFYGSSITEGGCASRAGNAYTSLVCRWLDADYFNFGFSGSARGEKVFAEFLADIEHMSALVYDYDHNAQSPEELLATHEPFFRIIRQKHPKLPVLMMSRPDVGKNPEDEKRRRDIIRATYEHARADGDEKVWFLDGAEFFTARERSECTVDGTHPTALGFMRMAEKVYPVLQEMLLK